MPRADAERNRERVLETARALVAEQGTGISLRDVARRAEVGLGTLYRHFPNREALLEALLRHRFEHLAERADRLAAELPPRPALAAWTAEFVVGAGAHRGLAADLLATLSDPTSPLHAACATMRGAGDRLLRAAQDAGEVRPDITGVELFALVSAVGWISDAVPAIADRQDHLLTVVLDGLDPR